VRAEFETALPQQGAGAEAAYQDYQRLVAPYPLGNIHPRFWGWVIGTGTPMGVVVDMLAATMNPYQDLALDQVRQHLMRSHA
jgi:hypothetical protein